MLSGIGKSYMVERIRKMKVATNLSKDSSTKKRNALIEVVPTPSDEDEHTNSALFLREKDEKSLPPLNPPTRMVELHIRRSSPSKSVS